MSSKHTSPPFDLSAIRYCEQHESHWIPWDGSTEKSAACPWCQRDLYWDELEDVYDVLLTASRQGEPLIPMEINTHLERLREVLSKTTRRGT